MKQARDLNLFRLYETFATRTASISLGITYVLLGALTVISVTAVFFRYVMGDPILWSEEISRYLMVWMALIGASVCVQKRLHVNLDFVVNRLPKRLSLSVEILFYSVICAVTVLIVVYGTLALVKQSAQSLSPSLHISMLWAHSAVPVGFSLILIQAVNILLQDLQAFFRAEEPAPGLQD
jgi:C4-dicarboxylate transporter DctQ subunit